MLQFPFERPSTAAHSVEILPGVNWIRLPLPFQLNHVNCWYLSGSTNSAASSEEKSSCLVDTGIATEQTSGLWSSLLKQFDLPTNVIATHFHPDHSGLAGWFYRQGCQVYASDIEMQITKRIYSFSDTAVGEAYASWYAQHAISDEDIEQVKKLGNTFRFTLSEPPETHHSLRNGANFKAGGRTYKVLTARGHSADMIMLYCADDNLLIAADQVLPSITPNVSLNTTTPDAESMDSNPLASFLEDIEQLLQLPGNTLVLPSHGDPFYGLHERVEQLKVHHRSRCHEIVAACTRPVTAHELFPVLFNRKLDAQQLSFALGEVLAHTRYLERRGEIQSELRNGYFTFTAIKS